MIESYTDRSTSARLPQPIAAAWKRLHALHTDDDGVMQHLMETHRIVLRVLLSFLLPDYLRGPTDPAAEAALLPLERPSDGALSSVVTSLIDAIHRREAPRPFMPEAHSWLHGTGSGRAAHDRTRVNIALVELRNKWAHRGARASKSAPRYQELLTQVVSSLDWLCPYRPIVLVDGRITESHRQKAFHGKVTLMTGYLPLGLIEPTAVHWREDACVQEERVYLSDPSGERLLSLHPFFQVAPKKEHTHCYVLMNVSNWRRMELRADGVDEPLIHILEGAHVRSPAALRASILTELIDLGTFHSGLRPEAGRPHARVGARYELQGELGSGGVATVYRALDRWTGKTCALKLLRDVLESDDTVRKRFVREAGILRQLSHPNVVPVLDLHGEGESRFFTMPVMAGGSLEQVIASGPQPEHVVVPWAIDLLRALTYLHDHDVIHRDIKPQNLLLDEQGRLSVADFGIALDASLSPRLTQTLERVGSVRYMSPEQLRRTNHTVTDKTDIYSAAVVLHELAYGSLPSDRLGEGIPGRLGALVHDMSRNNPDLRPSARQALDVMESLLAPASPSRTTSPDVAVEPAPPRPSAERGATPYRPSLVSIPHSALGSNSGGDEAEGLWIAKTPVTQGQYAALTGSNPAWFDEERGGSPSHPAESLSWYHAALYCNALSRCEGLPLAYDVTQGYRRVESSVGYRLPTETEWKASCLTVIPLTGVDLLDERRRHGWFCEDSSGSTSPVQQRPCNAWGLHDMWGNVAEWCDDCIKAPGSGEARAEWRPVMGGSFRASASDLSEVLRHLEPAGMKLNTIGFRVVAPIVGTKEGVRT